MKAESVTAGVGVGRPIGAWPLTTARLGQNLLGFLVSAVILRKFGLEAVGTLTVASFGVALQATLLNFGLPYILAKSALPLPQRNTVVLCAMFAGLLVCLPVSAGIGLAFGHDRVESAAIAVLAFNGAYFAQTTLLDALLVLHERTWLSPLGALGGLAGLAGATLFATTLFEFAIVLTAGRFAGVAAVLATLHFARCGWRQLSDHARLGLRYLLPDSLGLFSEQLMVAIVASLASRADLGLFGLCRQFLTAGETPLWSRLAALYPQFCTRPEAIGSQVRQTVARGIAIAIALSVVSSVLAATFYQAPRMVLLAPLLMWSLPFRYASGIAETGLRAVGSLAAVNRLGMIRLALLAAIPVAFALGRLQGVFAAILLQSAAMAWFSVRALRARNRGA